MIVDVASQGLTIGASKIQLPPSMGGAVDIPFILRMGKVGDAVRILPDNNKVLAGEELAEIVSAAEHDTLSNEDDRSCFIRLAIA